MRKFVLSLLLLAGVATTASVVFADPVDVDSRWPNASEPAYHTSHSAAGKYSSALKGQALYGDSTYVGYSPGQATAANPWSIRASITTPATNNVHRPPAAGCMWNWDPAEAGGNGFIKGDSLQGWWPTRVPWRFNQTTALPDYVQSTGGLDFGNLANYYPVQGRTYGVIGVWHKDPGGDPTGALPGSNGVTWTPLEGTNSAWCGIRAHGDDALKDPITGNPYTADLANFNSRVYYGGPVQTPKYPGFMDQWDQMLYRDIDMSSSPTGDLKIGFKYSTRISTTPDRAGWYDKDPLTITGQLIAVGPPAVYGPCAAGNYISSTDQGRLGPIDSFMVYVGQPVEGTFQPFNGTCAVPSGRLAIYDPLRRWFDEVIEANTPGRIYELVSTYGIDSARVAEVTIPNSQLSAILGASGNKVRLVFRVKTNYINSDMSTDAYNSRGRGAAQVDSVTYVNLGAGGASSPLHWGDFEAATSIDNTKDALLAWRSTGKPPTVMTHRAVLGASGLPYDDLCGADPTQTGRICSMNGGIISFGVPGLETIGDPTGYSADHETSNGIMSPTIQLCSNDGVEGVHVGAYAVGDWPNNIGIQAPGNQGDAIWGSDCFLDYEIFAKTATSNSPPVGTGLTYSWIIQCYPQLTGGNTPGKAQWGNLGQSYLNYQGDPICFRSLPGITGAEGNIASLGMVMYSTSAGENPNYPDSIKVGLQEQSRCWQTGVNACAPQGGLYVDNVSFLMVDGTPQLLSAAIWDFYQSAFPWNEGVAPGYTAAFDTTAILVKAATNIGPGIGTASYDVPGDSIAVTSDGVAPMRMDLVFRILPGPGNYVTDGNPASGLRKVPSSPTPISATPVVSSTNFWESFLADNGPFGTPGGHSGNGTIPGKWNPNVWNSARADTIFGSSALFPRSVAAPSASSWESSFEEHELGIGYGDAYAATTRVRSGLGVKRHRCFLPTEFASSTGGLDCVHDPDGIETPASDGSTYDLNYVLNTGSGYGPDLNGPHAYGRQYTVEGTKIIPDGMLTPGSHVEYFWRMAQGGSTAMAGMLPDTNVVVPQVGEGNADGGRWKAFGALPDRWKQSTFTHPLGLALSNPACMLVVNDQTRNTGDWLVWSGVADSIGATSNQKWGNEVGWHAKGGGADVNLPANNIDRAGRAGFIAEHGGNAGTTWDAYQITGAEDTDPAGSFGAYYAHQDALNTQVDGKRQQGTPKLEQLKTFYKIILWFTGNLNTFVMGPTSDRTSDDAQLIKDWLVSGNGLTLNRVFWAMGDGFVEGNEKEDPATGQIDLDVNYLGVALQNSSYRVEASNARTTISLTPNAGQAIANGSVYGVRNTCSHTNDVLKVATGNVQTETSVFMNYEDPTPTDAVTYPSTIFKKFTSPDAKPWASLTEGYAIGDLMSRFGADTRGRSKYFYEVLSKVFNSVCPVVGTPIVPLDVPNLGEGNMLADFVNLRNNPLSSGFAKIHFGLRADDRVQIKVFDVTGREMRVLADRQFKAGEHDIVWDGTDNAGRPVARGVYFTQVKYREGGFSDAKKLTVLK